MKTTEVSAHAVEPPVAGAVGFRGRLPHGRVSAYVPCGDRSETLRYLRGLVDHVLDFETSPEMRRYQRRLLDTLIWNITVVDGKYWTRFRSEGALATSDPKQLHHEHVWRRERLITHLLEHPGRATSTLRKAVGCTVTRTEHRLLTGVVQRDGWARYREAGIAVWDVQKTRWVSQAART